ncbi:GntR family transcriptional regulator [Paraburkholderia sp. BL8N3]|nr:PLP-dependent aminotransferase family protein [Paraburkholderia sp. BL8N3]TCK43469.1 GntR family transcriptional regulator [Paraburkholderia sp. BL8N3]
MRKISVEAAVLGAIDKTAGRVREQLARMLRDAISGGKLKPGERLPSTRTLADSLEVSRGTVTAVFSQLSAEGYVEGRMGAGTIVSRAWSEPEWQPKRTEFRSSPDMTTTLPANVERFAAVAKALRALPPVPFSTAVPKGGVALDNNWRRLSDRVRATQAASPTTYGDPAGLCSLREAVADYVRMSRAVQCTGDNVIITSGTQQGLYVSAHVLLEPGDVAWAENPAYPGLTTILTDAHTRLYRLPVDGDGMNVHHGIGKFPPARAVFVTPSHQYPLGMPLSMARRAALLTWVRENNAWIVEDDYNSELRYGGHSFPSMQGLDPERVIYLGTFSTVLAPSIRLGYAVVPNALVEAFAGAKALMDRHSSIADQHVIAAFMRKGWFESHIRRIRGVYAERRAALLAELAVQIPTLEVQPSDEGMHVVVWLPEGTDDCKVADDALEAGIAVRAISPMYGGSAPRAGLILGFGGFLVAQLRESVALLREVILQNGPSHV